MSNIVWGTPLFTHHSRTPAGLTRSVDVRTAPPDRFPKRLASAKHEPDT